MSRTPPCTCGAVRLRRRDLLLAGTASLLLAACGGGSDSDSGALPAGPRVPAETEPHQAMLLASPTLEYKQGWSNLLTQVEMVQALITELPVVYLCNAGPDGQPAAADVAALREALLQRGVPAALLAQRLRFVTAAHADYWLRDYGGIFLHDGQGGLSVVDFEFDGYGYLPFAGPVTRAVYEHDNDLSLRVASALGHGVRRSSLVAEGGNLHFNGRGTVVATELGLLGRNPGLSRPQVEQELRRSLGVRHVIWLPRGLATDAHTVLQTPYDFGQDPVYNIGVNHIDELVAWVDDRTLLLPEVTDADLAAAAAVGDPLAALNRSILDEAARLLSQATDQDGRPLTVVRVPEPGSILVELVPGDGAYEFIADLDAHPVHRLGGAERFRRREPVRMALPASYMNFIVTNGLVLVPRFHKPGRDAALAGKDQLFQQIVAARYPGRRVVAIDVDALVVGGGGMHCISQHLPAVPAA